MDEQIITVEEYPNDRMLIRGANGRIMKGSKPPGTIRTSEDSYKLKELKREKAQRIALQAVNNVALQSDITIPPDVETDFIGWYAINDHAANSYFANDNLRGLSEMMTKLGHNTGMIEKTDESRPGDITVSQDMQDLIRNIADIVRGE